MANNTYEKFKSLRDKINAVPELKKNQAVQQPLAEMDENFGKDEKYYDSCAQLIIALNTSVPKFSEPASSTAHVVSGVLDTAAGVLKIGNFFDAAKIFTGPASTVLKLAGAIIGVFGVSDKTRYYEAIVQMINDAIYGLNTALVKQDIAGVTNAMLANHNYMATQLAHPPKDPSVLLTKMNISILSDIINIAENELGAAFLNIAENIPTHMRDNWMNTADTFYHASQLIGFKALYLLEAIAYYNLAESNSDDDTATSSVCSELKRFKIHYTAQGRLYFTAPDLRHAVITQWLYRQPYQQLQLMGVIYEFLADSNDLFFGITPYFVCNISNRHNVGVQGYEKNMCVRLSTISAHEKKGKNRVLEIPADGASILINMPTSQYKERGITDQSVDFHYHSDGSKRERSHFYLIKQPNAKPPYNSWKLIGKNTVEEKASMKDSSKAGSTKLNDMKVQQEDFFIFQVFPNPEEIANSGKSIFPNDWDKKPEKDRKYYIIGSNIEDLVWCDHNGEDFEKASYYQVAFVSKHYGNPGHCMFYFMTQDEK